MQVVAPDEAVRLVVLGGAEGHTLHDLGGQVDAGVELAEALSPVPSLGLRLHRDRAETGRGAVELLLLRECL